MDTCLKKNFQLSPLLVKIKEYRPKIVQPEGVGAGGHLRNDTARNGVMMIQGTNLTVVNAEEKGDTALVRINPQKGILPALGQPIFIRLEKDDILLNLNSNSLGVLALGLNSSF